MVVKVANEAAFIAGQRANPYIVGSAWMLRSGLTDLSDFEQFVLTDDWPNDIGRCYA